MFAPDSLKKDRSFVICKPDKGNGVVLMNKIDYIKKMETILSDTSKFVPFTQDLFKVGVIHREDHLNSFLRKLRKEKLINESDYNSMYCTSAQPGILYGLPKVHKQGAPLRPILSACNTHHYNVAKFLVPLLHPITMSQYSLKDSFHFLKEISEVNTSNCVMASFDVTSLFTNIPLDETIDLCLNTLENDGHLFHRLGRDKFKALLTLAVKDSTFLFNGKAYSQVDGVAMGSPLGPTLANAFMAQNEINWLANCPSHFKPIFYRRYVDDTFAVFRDSEHCELFLNYLNMQHRSIQFTCEMETKETLPFLDVLVKREGSKLATSVYRKPTFTGLGMKFTSCLPSFYKFNLIKTLVYRAYCISSSYLSFHHDICFLKKFFCDNGFPINKVESTMGKTITKLVSVSEPAQRSHPETRLQIVIDFWGNSSYKFRNELVRLMKGYYPNTEVRIIFKAAKTIGSVFSYKDRIPSELQSGVVYNYTCGGCNASYIGQTSRQLKTRISEHQGVSFRTGKPFSSPSFSAIREHCRDCTGVVETSSFKILHRANKWDLPILETLFASVKRPDIGCHESSIKLVCF